MPKEIEALEREQTTLQALMNQADYFKRPVEEQRKNQSRLEDIESMSVEKLERWEALEAKV